MKSIPLFDHKWRWPALVVFIIFFGLSIIALFQEIEIATFDWTVFCVAGDELLGENVYFRFIEDNVFVEVCGLLSIFALLVFAFSREVQEDEMLISLRLNALIWAVYAHFAIIIFGIAFIYGTLFFTFLLLNLYSLLLIFVMRYAYLKKQLNKGSYEE